MEKSLGELYANTITYSQNPVEVKKLLSYYFRQAELKNKVVLDAGCRIGDYALPLLKMGARKVVGIDLSHECIKIARQKHQANNRVEFLQGDVANLSRFKNSTFDAIFCAGTMCYLTPEGARTALAEFVRVTKPGGVIIVMFQKNKGPLIQLAKIIANLLPLKVYLFLIDHWAYLFKPFVEKTIGRKITDRYLKYDVFFGLRGIYFGLPCRINKRFRIKTITCQNCSEATTASYKIIVPQDKKVLE
jgi:ubiquinone/menaquinone biosynthesis C-methylase UbiE